MAERDQPPPPRAAAPNLSLHSGRRLRGETEDELLLERPEPEGPEKRTRPCGCSSICRASGMA